MMYFLFRFHGWKPQDYFEMGYGARKVVAAFMYKEIEDRKKEIESIGG